MSKITPYSNQRLKELTQYTPKKEDLNITAKKTSNQDSVITDVKPELTTPEEALSLTADIVSKLQDSPATLLSAQGDLDESRILALLQDDE